MKSNKNLKRYKKPEMEVHGNIKEMTKGGQGSQDDSAGFRTLPPGGG